MAMTFLRIPPSSTPRGSVERYRRTALLLSAVATVVAVLMLREAATRLIGVCLARSRAKLGPEITQSFSWGMPRVRCAQVSGVV
jgi:hypothetical protein